MGKQISFLRRTAHLLDSAGRLTVYKKALDSNAGMRTSCVDGSCSVSLARLDAVQREALCHVGVQVVSTNSLNFQCTISANLHTKRTHRERKYHTPNTTDKHKKSRTPSRRKKDKTEISYTKYCVSRNFASKKIR